MPLLRYSDRNLPVLYFEDSVLTMDEHCGPRILGEDGQPAWHVPDLISRQQWVAYAPPHVISINLPPGEHQSDPPTSVSRSSPQGPEYYECVEVVFGDGDVLECDLYVSRITEDVEEYAVGRAERAKKIDAMNQRVLAGGSGQQGYETAEWLVDQDCASVTNKKNNEVIELSRLQSMYLEYMIRNRVIGVKAGMRGPDLEAAAQTDSGITSNTSFTQIMRRSKGKKKVALPFMGTLIRFDGRKKVHYLDPPI